MGCRYFLLLGELAAASRHEGCDVAQRLLEMGLRERQAIAATRLFASPETPTLRLADGGVAIGHLFQREGTPIVEPARPADDCWGEYLLVQRAEHGDGGVRITRDPSGGVACVHSVADGTGYATSDISIATRLGLHEKRVD